MAYKKSKWWKASLMGCVGWLALCSASVPIANGQTDASSAASTTSELAQQRDTVSENEANANVIQGELNSSSKAFDSGHYYQVHTLEGEAGEQNAIETINANFDTYLILRDWEGNEEIAKNDDGGEGKNAKIVITLPATPNLSSSCHQF